MSDEASKIELPFDMIVTWEAWYEPFPADLERLGADHFLDAVLAAIDAHSEGPLNHLLGDPMVSMEFDRRICISVIRERLSSSGGSFPNPFDKSTFQALVASMVGAAGLEGVVRRPEEIVTVTRKTTADGEDHGDKPGGE